MDKIPDLTLKTTDGVEPAVSKIISLIKESRAGHLCLLEEITVEESKLRGFQDLRRTFFGWVSHADGYKNQFARAEKAINRFLITDDTQQLSVELIKSGVQSTKAETVVADLAAAVLKLRALTYDTLPIADTADGPVEIEVAGDDEEADNVSILLTGRKTKVAVARPIWKDLRTRFHAFVPLAEPDLDDEELETLFTEYATWMRMKYMVLTGGRGMGKKNIAFLACVRAMNGEAFCTFNLSFYPNPAPFRRPARLHTKRGHDASPPPLWGPYRALLVPFELCEVRTLHHHHHDNTTNPLLLPHA